MVGSCVWNEWDESTSAIHGCGVCRVVMPAHHILAIPGSLRAASLNRAVLCALARIAPPGVHVQLYGEIAVLPLFNPDLEGREPAAVLELWNAVTMADALVIASPEYAHGVTGAIKNVLDWLVGLPAFYGKAVAVINTSPRAHHADDALRETLRTMSAVILDEASLTIPLLGAGLRNDDELLASAELRGHVMHVLDAILRHIALRRPPGLAAFRTE